MPQTQIPQYEKVDLNQLNLAVRPNLFYQAANYFFTGAVFDANTKFILKFEKYFFPLEDTSQEPLCTSKINLFKELFLNFLLQKTVLLKEHF